MGFHTPIDLAPQGSLFRIVSAERSREALLHKPLFDADDGPWADFQSFCYLATGGRLLVTFVGFEQHAGCHLLMSCGFPGMDQVPQLLPLLCAEMDRIAFFTHDMSPSLSWSLFPQFLSFSPLCHIQVGELVTAPPHTLINKCGGRKGLTICMASLQQH
jgi:hypothetical protein